MNNEEFSVSKTNQGKINYCSRCGFKVNDNDIYCNSCGSKLITEIDNNQTTENAKSKKCPNCGASIKSFQTTCGYCHTEIFEIKIPNIIKDFSNGLVKIKSKPLPKYDGKDSIMKRMFGKDFNNVDAKAEFESKCIAQRDEEIANYIINYPVPNSKEDLTEFMILVSSNINTKKSTNNKEQSAWKEKMEQIYKKASISIMENEDFKRIEDIYKSHKNLNINSNNKGIIIGACIVGYYLLVQFSIHPFLTIIFTLLVGGIPIYIYLNHKGIINFGWNDAKTILEKIYKTIKNIILKIKNWYKNLSLSQKKPIFIASSIIILSFFSIVIYNKVVNGVVNYSKSIKNNEEVKFRKIDNKTTNDNKKVETNDYSLDFKTAEQFESALNNGEKVKGKLVQFKINEYNPDSALGINCWAGEHLNFISEKELDVEKGFSIIGKVTSEPDNFFHSWIIKYEALKIIKSTDKETSKENVKKNISDKKETIDDENQNKILISYDSSYFIGKNSSDIKKELQKLGFNNIKEKNETTSNSNNKSNKITSIKINGLDIVASMEYDKNSEIVITCWKYVKSLTDEIQLPKKGSKIEKDFLEKSDSTVYYINVDGNNNIPKLQSWNNVIVTDAIAEYLNNLVEIGFKVEIIKSDSRVPYEGFTYYETELRVYSNNVSWTMNCLIQVEKYVEYELDINLK